MQSLNKQLEIKVNSEEYSFNSDFGSRTFPLGKEIDENLPNGDVMKVKHNNVQFEYCLNKKIFKHRAPHHFLVINLSSNQ